MLTPEEIRTRLADRRLTVVAQYCEVSYSTLLRFMRGERMPRAGTLIKLSRYLEQK